MLECLKAGLQLHSFSITFEMMFENLYFTIQTSRGYEYSADGLLWKAALRGDRLLSNTHLRTGPGSSGIIRFLDGSVLRLQEQTEVLLAGTRESAEAVKGREVVLRLGNIGFERLNKNKTSSFQIQYSIAGGSVATDVGDTKRKWFTVERTIYVKSKQPTNFVYSFFIELGSRTKFPGNIEPRSDSVPRYTKSFEICPGVAVGFHHKFDTHWAIGLLTGPKLIFTNRQTKYYNTVTRNEFIVKAGNSITTGVRFTPYISFQF